MKNIYNKIIEQIRTVPVLFFIHILVIFFVLVSISSFLGILDESETSNITKDDIDTSLNEIIPEIPVKIIIDKVGVNVKIENPQSRNISVLNETLKDGAVHYPGSGLIGARSNVFLFGHSSNLPVVLNQNYKAFNNIEDLVPGDKISVYSENTEFIYEVFDIREADANDFRVDFNTSRRLLTLSTCNNFGDLSDRFVVQAELVGTRSLE